MLYLRVQDRVSLVSSRLWLMLLPSSLLRELADISKLLVSGLQVEELFFVIDLLFPPVEQPFWEISCPGGQRWDGGGLGREQSSSERGGGPL